MLVLYEIAHKCYVIIEHYYTGQHIHAIIIQDYSGQHMNARIIKLAHECCYYTGHHMLLQCTVQGQDEMRRGALGHQKGLLPLLISTTTHLHQQVIPLGPLMSQQQWRLTQDARALYPIAKVTRYSHGKPDVVAMKTVQRTLSQAES